MIDIVGIPPFLRIALPVAMETMHFHTGHFISSTARSAKELL